MLGDFKKIARKCSVGDFESINVEKFRKNDSFIKLEGIFCGLKGSCRQKNLAYLNHSKAGNAWRFQKYKNFN